MNVFELDHWLEVFQSLRRNRLRTLLTGFGVFWGVLMLIVMLGFGKGLERGATDGFGSFAQNAVFLWADATSKAHAGRQPGRRIALTMQDVEAIRTQVAGVELAVPRNFMGGRFGQSRVSRRDKSEGFGLMGETEDYARLEAFEMIRGRFLNPADLAEARKVAIIGSRVAEVLFDKGEDPVGELVRVGNTEIMVVGVYHSPAKDGRAERVNGRVFLPRTTLARMNGTGDRIDGIAVLVSPERSSVEVEAECKAMLKARHAVHPADPRGVGAFNRAREFGKVRGIMTGISILTWIVGVLTLISGAIGVSNIMMIAVAERTREIGIRKALGARPLWIMGQILTEATVLTGLAGYLGLVFGVAAVEIAGRFFAAMPAGGSGPSLFGRPEVDVRIALLAALALTLAGAIAGLAPARRAVAIRPVEALAHE